MVAFTQEPQELNLPGRVVIPRTQEPQAPMYRVSDGPVIPVMAFTRTHEPQALNVPSLPWPKCSYGGLLRGPKNPHGLYHDHDSRKPMAPNYRVLVGPRVPKMTLHEDERTPRR